MDSLAPAGGTSRIASESSSAGDDFKGRVLLLAMADPAPHPALFAAYLAAALSSTTTGHAFSLGSLNSLGHDGHTRCMISAEENPIV
jgi:hypothetical protein